MTTTWWFEVTGESNLTGEEFFVEVNAPLPLSNARAFAIAKAHEIFPTEELNCLGYVTRYEAEMMGLDTY